MIATSGSAANQTPPPKPDAATLARVRQLLREVPLIDGHNDLPWQYRKRTTTSLQSTWLATPASSPRR